MSNEQVHNIVIIGSGPAALTAAIYTARAQLLPLVIPGRAIGKDLMPGGQLMMTTDIDNFPGFPDGIPGPDLMQRFYTQAVNAGAMILTDNGIKSGNDLTAGLFTPSQSVSRVDLSSHPFTITSNTDEIFSAKSIIVATGAKANWLGLDNETRLARSGGGVSACAVCDGALPMFRDARLAVVGGGDSAVEEALYLTRFASKVYMIVRRDVLRASPIMRQRAMNNDKIEILWNTNILDILGDKNVTAAKLRNNKTGNETQLPLAGIFMALGHTPITQFLDNQLELDEKGYIKLRDYERTMTSVEGVFAAGDVADSIYRQAVTAAAMGCKAAIDTQHWLTNQD